MAENKLKNWKKSEFVFLFFVWVFIIAQGVIGKDSPIAMISAICGITYTFIAGKGNPICYLFGLLGSAFYCALAFKNSLWGNLLLYALYYIPMQILGFFRWNKHLHKDENVIIKISLPNKEKNCLLLILFFLTVCAYFVLLHHNDAHPILDSITTIFSIGGMYLTVRRAIEQWQFWMLVNALSLIMWVNVVLSGTRAYSTVIMWAVYLILAFYFYFTWKKEMKILESKV